MTDTSATSEQITRALSRLFARHRIVVWSDPTEQFGDEYLTVGLDGVTTLTVANNEFGLMHRVLRAERDAKFLLYRAGEPPAERDNWLLNLELAFGTFVGDRDTLLAQDVGLPEGLEALAAEHAKFFTTAKRRNALTALLTADDSADRVREKMLAVVAGSDEASLGPVLRSLLQSAADSDPQAEDLLAECALDRFLWQETAKRFGYSPTNPTVDDFAWWLFDQSLQTLGSGATPKADGRKAAADVFFRSWQDSMKHSPGFRVLSATLANTLNVKNKINEWDFRDLVSADAFRVFDEKILTDLTADVVADKVNAQDVAAWVRDRRRSFWVDDPTDPQHLLRNLYDAVESAAGFFALMAAFQPVIESIDDGLSKYTESWFKIDQTYRKFTFHVREADNHPVLESLQERVEKFYINKFLRPLGDSWQHHVGEAKPWRATSFRSQREFFAAHVTPMIKGDRNKAVVIISDGMRYEVADELRRRIRQEDRYEADLDHMLGVLPSYTQLGMASLLPNKTLEPDDKSYVKVDGLPSSGTANRAKILEGSEGTAIECEAFLAMNAAETRELLKSARVLYVYHNLIDKTGDEKMTEPRVFQAAEETFDEMLALLKKLTSANANNILITADHGFLYQDTKLTEGEYISEKAQGERIDYQSSRFVLGQDLKAGSAFTKFTANDLGLTGDMEVLVPKSIGRLKKAGGGTRYVHGGAALQEIVIPVVTVSKKRTSDVKLVDVEQVVRSTMITTSQIQVELYQANPVSEKTQLRTLRIGLYVGEVLISNQLTHVFDLEDEDPRDRSVSLQLLLSNAADDYDGQQVELRLEAPIPKTNRFEEYAKTTYTLRRSFKPDF